MTVEFLDPCLRQLCKLTIPWMYFLAFKPLVLGIAAALKIIDKGLSYLMVNLKTCLGFFCCLKTKLQFGI